MNYSKKNFFLFIFLFVFGQIYAQNTTNISGNIIDEDKKSIPFANVILRQTKDNQLIKVAVTDTLGRFEFENINEGEYHLNINYVGFKDFKSENITLIKQKNTIIPTITLELSGTLKEVTIVYKKPFAEQKIDRTIINPDVLITNAGISALEVLEKSPGVQVSLEGNISLKGKSGVVVFIDDKPTYMSADALASYLKSLPSSTIETIELMPNPPAKYDAAGNAGIINIRLKKNTLKGFNGSISLAFGQGFYSRTNNSINLNYRINKFNFFSNISMNMNNDYQDLLIERKYLKNDGSVNATFRQNSFIKNERYSNNIRLGADYYLSDKTTLGVVFSGFYNPTTATNTNKSTLFNQFQQSDSTINAVNINNRKWWNGSVNFNYSYKIDKKGKEISANIDYINYTADINQNLENSVFLSDNTLKTQDILRGVLPADIDIYTFKVDYAQPLKKGGTFEAGFKSGLVKTKNVAQFTNEKNNLTTVNNDLSNLFDYNENINAAYLNFSKDFKKISVQAGLRMENTNLEGLQFGNPIKRDSSFKRNYTNLFPTFYLNYRPDSLGKNVFGFSYGRRINRPNYQSLNPFSYPLDRFTIYAGNPFLLPTFSHNFELTHTYKSKITTALTYSYTQNIITETIEFEGTLFYSRPGNIGTQKNLTLTINGGFNPLSWWTMQLYAQVTYNQSLSLIYGENLNNTGTFYSTNFVNQFQLGKGWSSEINFNYQSAAYSAQFVTIPFWRAGVGIQKKIMKDKGALKLNVSDVFFTFQPGGDILGLGNAAARFYSVLDSRVFTLNFSYRFSKGSNLKLRKSGGADDEKNRIQTK
ncbi:MAG: TonB-dependent receptor [Cytophagia bacterium]|nr:MAG: TonB-dependent receptor [Cytophagia bacterium]TAG43059.1 MAG: TonB-dependent receptor [Cytophagia bacterium]